MLKHDTPPQAQWLKRTFSLVDDSALDYYYNLAFHICPDSKSRYFQYKILHNILGLNVKLKQMKIKADDRCDFCHNCVETRVHLFFECSLVSLMWQEFEKWWYGKFNENIKLSARDIILGVESGTNYRQLLNICILDIKMYLFDCKYNEKSPILDGGIHKFMRRQRIEHIIHRKRLTLAKFYSRWSVLLLADL